LECQNLELNQNLRQLQEKLSAHDVAAKRTIARLQQDSENKIKELNKMCAQVKSEQQTSVMNFARREKEVLDLRQKKDAAEMYARNTTKERERAVAQLKTVKADFIKCKNMLERKEGEYNAQKQEVEKLKEEINSQIIKVRWAQNKLKTEVDSHKETKEKCDKMVAEIQQAKEETEQIRKNCQGMIKTYQESEEIKSNALDIELKEKLQTLNEKETETMEVRAVLKQKSEELNMIKIKHKDLLEEEKVLKSRVECLETERLNNDQVLRGYEEVMNKQKLSAGDMADRLQAMDKLQEELATVTTECNEIKCALEEATEKCETALSDLACKEEKEQELLQFTERMSSKNTELAVKVEELNTKVTFQTEEIDSLKGEKVQLLSEIQNVSTTLGQQMSSSQKSTTDMTSRLQEKEKTICQLLLQIEDLKDEMRTVKRKNNACVKDLTRQLTQAKRKMDNADALSNSSGPTSTNHSADCGSMGSRASSTNSLDRMHSYPETNGIPETTITGPGAGPADRQMLIERIVRLQQIHAKKNDKIDFLQEHVQQLVEELQKKHRLIQHYVMREEAGVLAPPRENKDSKPKHGLTLDLSLEINRKMQSVLEDTLLKNITLKESLEMLGKRSSKI
uniref:Coiled-coil domain-containing protein 186 n=1 Tax=Ciona savignyi TaxID=51511 RepID=H2Z878_CIOSA